MHTEKNMKREIASASPRNDRKEEARNDKKEKRNRLLAALFAKAKRIGIEQEFLRDTIAENIIGKRLSEASSKEIFKVLEHLVKGTGKTTPFNSPFKKGELGGFKYKSSRAGLIEELTDVAKARWGMDFEKSLNAFVNSHRKTPTHWKFLDVTTMKEIKERLKEMNEQREIASASPRNDRKEEARNDNIGGDDAIR